MKVCFVDPKGMHFGLNTGIGYIVSSLRKVPGIEAVKVFDFNNNPDKIPQRIKEISAYDAVGFSIKSFTRDAAMEIAVQVKTDSNILFAGGPHITLDGVNFLREHQIFDVGFMGEGELSVGAYLEAIASGQDLSSVKGLIYREGNDVVVSSPGDRITDLDSLPFPDYSSFDSVSDKKIYNYPLVTSRGCPYLCIYCCVKGVMGRTWISRSVDNVMEELLAAQRVYNISCFNIQDDNFSLNLKRAKEFCRSIVQRGLAMKWSCPNGIRADRVDDELIDCMQQAGCFGVAMGIESGVEKEFVAIKKGEELSDIVNAVELSNRYGIQVFGNFIIGLPHSTLKSVRESVKFARSLRLESCIFNLFVPFPGTEVWDWVEMNGTMLMDWKDGFAQGKNPRIVFETDEFPRADRLKAYYEANVMCKNYFAFMDEHDGLLSNIVSVISGIIRYDAVHIPEHILWCLKHFRRIIARITEKNS